MLEGKSLTDLRTIWCALGGTLDLSMTERQLIQAIETKQQNMYAPKVDLPPVVADGRLTYKSPAKRPDTVLVMELLQPYIDKGLRFDVQDDDTWTMIYRKGAQDRRDTGSLRTAPRVIVGCARRLMS